MNWTHRLRIRQLFVLVSLYEARNISRTASRLHMTQPALSRWLTELESDIGMTLFERQPRGLVPTIACEQLIVHARRILNEISRTEASIEAILAGGQADLNVGVTLSAAGALLVGAISRFRQTYEQVKIRITDGAVDKLIPLLRDGQLDFVLTAVSPVIAAEASFQHEILFAEGTAIVCSPRHPLAKQATVGWADTTPYGWIMPSIDGVACSAITRDLSLAGQPPPKVRIEVLSASSTLRLLQDDHLLAILPSRTAQAFLHTRILNILPLAIQQTASIGLLRPLEWAETPVHQAFIQAVNAEVRDPTTPAGFGQEARQD
jgi:DNA-binding transcriptional LysR family regulator